MDIAMINAVANTQTAVANAQSTTTEGLSFASLLAGLQQGNLATGQNPLASEGYSWREMLAFGQTMASQQSLGILGGTLQTGNPLDELIENIMNLVAGMKNAAANSEDLAQTEDDLLAMISQLQKKLEQTQAADGQIVAGQQLLVLLAQFSAQPLTPVLTAEGTMELNLTDGQATLQTLLEKSPEDILMLLRGEGGQTSAPVSPQASASSNFANLLAPQATLAQPLAAETQAAVAQTMEQAAQPLAVQQPAQPSAENMGQPLAAPVQATEETGANAAQTGTKTPEKTPAETVSLDGLQQQVNTLSPMHTAVVTTGNATAANLPAPLATQLQQGIQTGLQAGQQEFSIKLMPEGLGEVTVRLKQSSEGMILTLVTKSAETQRMLAGEIDQLRDALRPMRIEVQQVLTNRQEEMLNFQQNFQNQHQRQWQEMHGARYYGDEPLGQGEGSEDTAETAPVPQPALSGLDTYI